MEYSLDDIKKAVRVTLEMNDVDGQLELDEDIDTLSLDDVILAKVLPSVRLIENAAPFNLLGIGKQLEGDIQWENPDKPGIGMGSIILPDDFMRPLVFQMTDWRRQAIFITEDDALYTMQTSRFKGVRGNPEKPVVAIVPSSFGNVLEFYSCVAGDDAAIKQARYIPFPKISEYDTIDISEKLYDACVTYIASQVALSYQNAEVAAMLRSRAYDMAEIKFQSQPAPQDTNTQSQ